MYCAHVRLGGEHEFEGTLARDLGARREPPGDRERRLLVMHQPHCAIEELIKLMPAPDFPTADALSIRPEISLPAKPEH